MVYRVINIYKCNVNGCSANVYAPVCISIKVKKKSRPTQFKACQSAELIAIRRFLSTLRSFLIKSEKCGAGRPFRLINKKALYARGDYAA